MAPKLAQGLAIATFMQWPEARDAVYACARDYRIDDGMVRAEGLGEREEWPSRIYEEKAKFELAEGQVLALEAQLQADLGDEDNGPERGYARCRSLSAELERIKRAIADNMGAFESPAIALEMVDRIARHCDEVVRQRDEFRRRLTASVDLPPECAPDDEAAANDAALADVTRLKGSVREYAAQEEVLFTRIRGNLPSAHADKGWPARAGAALTSSSSDIIEAQARIRDLYESWRGQVLALRDAYGRAGVGESWLVSRARGEPREDAEPDVQQFAALVNEAADAFTTLSHGRADMIKWARQYSDY